MANPNTHYEQMYAALKRISQYQSPKRMHRHSSRDWGLDNANEAIEMAYENVIQEAKRGLKGVRKRKSALPQSTAQGGEG